MLNNPFNTIGLFADNQESLLAAVILTKTESNETVFDNITLQQGQTAVINWTFSISNNV